MPGRTHRGEPSHFGPGGKKEAAGACGGCGQAMELQCFLGTFVLFRWQKADWRAIHSRFPDTSAMVRITAAQSKTVPMSSKAEWQTTRSVRRPAALFLSAIRKLGLSNGFTGMGAAK